MEYYCHQVCVPQIEVWAILLAFQGRERPEMSQILVFFVIDILATCIYDNIYIVHGSIELDDEYRGTPILFE